MNLGGGGLWVIGGNHFPRLLNKAIKKHYELASGKAFACHCLHLFKGVSAFLCFFGLVRTKILHQNIDEATETKGGEIRRAEGDDAGHTPSAPRSSVSIHEDFFSFIGGVID